MTTLVSNGVTVKFPFEPYPSQVTLALLTGTNALLESPTGTGKTLCLLCGSLAWHTYNKSMLPKAPSAGLPLQYSDGPVPPLTSVRPGAPKPSVIVYASRTHAQLAQVVSELRGSGYTPRMSVLGSREQLCIHGRISKLRGSALNHACNSTSASRGCTYKNNLESYKGNSEGVGNAPSPILDIEQLNELGRKDQICPYFFSRDNSTNADIVLLPYNYLVDTSIRATLKIAWENAVVIFDEAHNLESVATDATSFSLSSTDVAACISEMQDVVRLLRSHAPDTDGGRAAEKADGGPVPPNEDRCLKILRGLFDLEQRLDSIQLAAISHMGSSVGKVFPGQWLLGVMEQSGFSFEEAAMNLEEIVKCSNYLLDDLTKVMGDMAGMGSKAPEPKLALFAKAFSKLFRGKTKHACYENTSLYKVYLAEEQQQKSNFKGSFQNKMSPGVTTASPPAKKRVLNYWCFSTGLAVEEIKGLGVRSIVLTSGTLSPMASFKEDLRVPFPIELENPHVIREREQIWVGMLTAGPSGKELNSSFAQRDLGYIKDELGNTILAICQTMVGQRPMSSSIAIPQGPELKGGVLVFFPSYGAMESCRKHWFESGLWAKLKTTIGNVVVESKGSGGESSQASIGRSNNVNAAAKGNFFSGEASTIKPDENTPESAIQEFENAIQTTGGKCILMAVCRGKMSEGIDFRDKKGRVVIITGIPYAPHMDPWVVLKREYLDSRLSGVGKSSSQLVQGGVTTGITKAGPLLLGPHPYGRPINSTPYVSVTSQQITAAAGASPGLPAGVGNISGQTWYDQSAMRAVNQALGRVIRHKDDWGAIFFLDSRFQQPNKIAQLSKWVRPTVKKYPQLPPALVDFRAFITKAMNDPILTPVPKANAPARTFSIPKYIPHASMIAPEPQSTNHPSRAVTIPASALGSNRASMGDFGLSGEFGEVDYVDPSLLMTQQSERSGRTDNAFGLTMSKSSFVDDVYSQPSSQTSDIDSIYKSAKQARPAIPLQKKSLSTALSGRDDPTSKSALRDVWGEDKKMAKPVSAMYGFAKDNSGGFKGFESSRSNEADQDIGLVAGEQAETLGTNAQTNVASATGSQFEFLKALTVDLKTRVPIDIFNRFKQDIARVVQNPKALESITAIRQFVDIVYNTLSKHMRGSALLGVMTRLVPLVPGRHTSLYNATTRRLCQLQQLESVLVEDSKIVSEETAQSISSLQSVPLLTESSSSCPQYKAPLVTVNGIKFTPASGQKHPETIKQPSGRIGSDFRQIHSSTSAQSTVQELDNIYKRVHSQLDSNCNVTDLSQSPDVMTQSIVHASSKRARNMVLGSESKVAAPRMSAHSLLSTSNAAAKPKTKQLSLFDKVGQIKGGDRVPLVGSSAAVNGISKVHQLVCTVCKENVSDPHAARCGHICCIRCWKSWLKGSGKQSCPLCRKDVEYSQLTKIIIQNS